MVRHIAALCGIVYHMIGYDGPFTDYAERFWPPRTLGAGGPPPQPPDGGAAA